MRQRIENFQHSMLSSRLSSRLRSVRAGRESGRGGRVTVLMSRKRWIWQDNFHTGPYEHERKQGGFVVWRRGKTCSFGGPHETASGFLWASTPEALSALLDEEPKSFVWRLGNPLSADEIENLTAEFRWKQVPPPYDDH